MGEGITGTAAQRGQTLNIPDAQHCEFAEDIEGSADIEESILAVPRYERRTIGVIVLSKLGLDQFSQLSVRLLELLAAQAAVAFENARLLEAERRSAAISQALLEIATAAATDPSVQAVAAHLTRVTRALSGVQAAALVAVPQGGRGPRLLRRVAATPFARWRWRPCGPATRSRTTCRWSRSMRCICVRPPLPAVWWRRSRSTTRCWWC